MPHAKLPDTPGIYKICFLDPDKFYIGSTVNLRRRYNAHFNALHKGNHKNKHLQNACAIYGIDAFHFEIVEHVAQKEDLIAREQHYLDQNPHYNICQIAYGPPEYELTPEIRAKISASLMGNTRCAGCVPHNKGKTYSDEERAKMSADQMGKKHSSQTKAKMSASRKGKPSGITGKSSRKKGTTLSPETREQMRIKGRATRAAKGNPPSPKKGTHLSPEDRMRALEKRRANREAKQGAKQFSLWDENTAL